MEQKNNSGSLFRNKKTKEVQPDYTGAAIIGNKKYQIAGWINKSRSGVNYMRLIFEEVNLLGSDLDNSSQTKAPLTPGNSQSWDHAGFSDDLPF